MCVKILTELITFYTAYLTGFAACSMGDVKLTNVTNDAEEESRQGTLQICINNAWGAICSDNYFDDTDAEVFCDWLVGFSSTGENMPCTACEMVNAS